MVVSSSFQPLRNIAAAIRAMPEVGKNDLPGPFCDDCGGFFWKAMELGAFAGPEYDRLRLLVQRQRNEADRNPRYKWKRAIWHRVAEYLLPDQSGHPSEQWRNACGPVADLIDAEAAKLKKNNGKDGKKRGGGRPKDPEVQARNKRIAADFRKGLTIDAVAEKYGIGVDLARQVKSQAEKHADKSGKSRQS